MLSDECNNEINNENDNVVNLNDNDIEQTKNNEGNNEDKKFKVEKYECKHGCNHIFRTKRQKILHHDKLDNYCHVEKMNLLLLIEVFENSINKLIPDEKERRKYIQYTLLLKQIGIVRKKTIDKIQMKGFLKEQ
jgi:hypothetical protein